MRIDWDDKSGLARVTPVSRRVSATPVDRTLAVARTTGVQVASVVVSAETVLFFSLVRGGA